MDGTTPGAAVQCSVRGGGITLYSGLLILSEPKRFVLYTAPNSDSYSCSQLKLRWLFIAQHISSPAPCSAQWPPPPWHGWHLIHTNILVSAWWGRPPRYSNGEYDNSSTERHGSSIYSLAHFLHHCIVVFRMILLSILVLRGFRLMSIFTFFANLANKNQKLTKYAVNHLWNNLCLYSRNLSWAGSPNLSRHRARRRTEVPRHRPQSRGAQ